MSPEDLPAPTRTKFDHVLKAIQEVLDAQGESPHVRAVAYGSMDEDLSLHGGVVRPAEHPYFECDEFALGQHFEALFKPALALLRGIVVHASRANDKAKWQLTAKLISRAEHRALEAARRPIEADLERELRKVVPKTGWDSVSFGRDAVGGPVRLFRRLKNTKSEQLEPDPVLLDLFERTVDIYRKAALDLQIAKWSLRPSGLDFHEYYVCTLPDEAALDYPP